MLFAAVTLSACVNTAPTPDTYYYVLDASPQSFASKTVDKPLKSYKVLPVQVPDYLNQTNLVLKLSDHQIKITHYHYWAEDLRQSIQRIIINELNQANSEASFSKQCGQCAPLQISLQHFYPTESGDVVLAGTYQITSHSAKGKRTEQQYSFSFNRSLETGGYDEAVATMRLLLDDLAIQINQNLN
jgi:uncharacterized lipoprotein YmbA